MKNELLDGINSMIEESKAEPITMETAKKMNLQDKQKDAQNLNKAKDMATKAGETKMAETLGNMAKKTAPSYTKQAGYNPNFDIKKYGHLYNDDGTLTVEGDHWMRDNQDPQEAQWLKPGFQNKNNYMNELVKMAKSGASKEQLAKRVQQIEPNIDPFDDLNNIVDEAMYQATGKGSLRNDEFKGELNDQYIRNQIEKGKTASEIQKDLIENYNVREEDAPRIVAQIQNEYDEQPNEVIDYDFDDESARNTNIVSIAESEIGGNVLESKDTFEKAKQWIVANGYAKSDSQASDLIESTLSDIGKQKLNQMLEQNNGLNVNYLTRKPANRYDMMDAYKEMDGFLNKNQLGTIKEVSMDTLNKLMNDPLDDVDEKILNKDGGVQTFYSKDSNDVLIVDPQGYNYIRYGMIAPRNEIDGFDQTKNDYSKNGRPLNMIDDFQSVNVRDGITTKQAWQEMLNGKSFWEAVLKKPYSSGAGLDSEPRNQLAEMIAEDNGVTWDQLWDLSEKNEKAKFPQGTTYEEDDNEQPQVDMTYAKNLYQVMSNKGLSLDMIISILKESGLSSKEINEIID